MVVEKIILIIYIGIILYLGIWDITEQYMSHIIIFTSSIILCVWVLYSLKKLTKNNISKQLYPTMEFLTTDFWNYLHFLLLVSIFILILKDRKKLKKNQRIKTRRRFGIVSRNNSQLKFYQREYTFKGREYPFKTLLCKNLVLY